MNIVLARLRTLLATISVKAGDVFEKDQVIQIKDLSNGGRVVNVSGKSTNTSVVREPVNSESYKKSPNSDAFKRFLAQYDGNKNDGGNAVLTQALRNKLIECADNDNKHFRKGKDNSVYYKTGEPAKNSGKEYKVISKYLHLKQTAEGKMTISVDAVNVDNPDREKFVIEFKADYVVDWYAEVQRQTDGENAGKYVATGTCLPMLDTDKITNVSYSSNQKHDTSFTSSDDKQENYGKETIEALQIAVDNAIRGYASKFIEFNPNVSEKRNFDGLNPSSVFSIGKYLGMTESKGKVKLKPEFVDFLKNELGKTDEEISKIDKFSNEFKDYARYCISTQVKPKVEELVDALKALKENLNSCDSLTKEQVVSLEEKIAIFLNKEDSNGQIKAKGLDGHLLYDGQKPTLGRFCKWALGISKKIDGINMTFEGFLDYCRSFK